MAQELSQIQEQRQQLVQTQHLSAQQVQVVRMMEMPLAQLEEYIEKEKCENPALESEDMPDDNDNMYGDAPSADDDNDGTDSFEEKAEREEREDELDRVLESFDNDDRMPGSDYERSNNRDMDADQEERVYGSVESFYDSLMEQVGEQNLTPVQRQVMEYLIGSLDADGLLRKDFTTLSDELLIRESMDVSEREIEKVVVMLQSFDPAGIGAQSLQECLLIQIFRRESSSLTTLMYEVISHHYNDFTKRNWRRIKEQMGMSDITAEEVFSEILKLNPRPGAALGESVGRSSEQVTPDFTIELSEDDRVSFTLNSGRIPSLCVSHDLQQMIEGYQQNPKSMTRKDKEALLYAQENVRRARLFIDAVAQRQKTMTKTMAAIVSLQKAYLQSGDECDLRPMILRDVADMAQVDISTVSRVCSSKYADTPWGILPLKSFFSQGYDTGDGEEISTREIKKALKSLVDNETKGKPLSDEKLKKELEKLGYPIARRTVAKYREKLGIPPSHMRK